MGVTGYMVLFFISRKFERLKLKVKLGAKGPFQLYVQLFDPDDNLVTTITLLHLQPSFISSESESS
jgi:hypothetical protein